MAVNGEVDLDPIWQFSHEHGKTCYFPVLTKEKILCFLPATPSTPFKMNQYNIPEPDIDIGQALSPKELDLIIMPLVAFDARCTRLGMGAGYYDRTLENKPTVPLFGVAYQFQRVDFIDPQPWDIPLDAVITQNAIYWRNFLTRQD
jgi:5-formyltetrahydrofolate cyclo-ligase